MGKKKEQKANEARFFGSLLDDLGVKKDMSENAKKIQGKCREIKSAIHEMAKNKKENVAKNEIVEQLNKHYFNIGSLYVRGNYQVDDYHITSYETQIEKIQKDIKEIYAKYKKEGEGNNGK